MKAAPLAKFHASQSAGVIPHSEWKRFGATLAAEVGKAYEIAPADVLGKKRAFDVVFARQIVMFVARRETNLSLHRIADLFGLDHGTVLNSERRVQDIMDVYPTDRAKIIGIARELFGDLSNLGDKENATT